MLTLAIPQFRPRKGDVEGNLDRVAALVVEAARLEPAPQLVLFAESILTGYFVEGGVRELALTSDALVDALESRLRVLAPDLAPTDLILGFYESHEGTLYNSAACVAVGGDEPARLVHLHRKNFLPTYSMFDEDRFVERGYGIEAFDTSWGRVAMLVCEDAWHSLSGTIAALDGAQLVCVLAAAPARGSAPRDDNVPGPATVARWERLIRDIADEHGVFCALASLVGSEGGRMFQGGSLVAGPRGEIRVRAPIFEEAMLTASIELDDITRARADLSLLSDLRAALPRLRRELDRAAGLDESEKGAARPAAKSASKASTAATSKKKTAAKSKKSASASPATTMGAVSAPLPLVGGVDSTRGQPPSLDIDAALVEQWLVAFLRDEFARRGFKKAVVGLSGGVDSAVVAALAARALGPENVIAVRMPYRTSSPDSLAHAQLVIDQLGLAHTTVDISPAVDGYLATEPDADGARRGNVMARMRMITLFDLSAKHHALPLGTGNKSERLLGYFTWHADDSPPVNAIGDLFKTQVWALAVWLGIPAEIVAKPASADLIAGQTDEGDFGVSYAVADEILNWILHGWTKKELLARGMDAESLGLVTTRLNGTHWKRKLPTVAMLSAAAIGESYLRPVDF